MSTTGNGPGVDEARLARLEQQLRALREIGLALESTMSFDEVLTLAVERTTRCMNAARSTLFLAGEDGRLVSRVIEGAGVREIRLEPGQGLAGWVARHGRPLCVPDAYADERFDRSWDERSGFRTRSVLCHPLLGRHGTVIGVVEVLNRLAGEFDRDDLELLGLLCGQLALTIENSQLLIDLVGKNRALTEAKVGLERRARELTLLLDLERLASRAEDLDQLASAVLGRVNGITGAAVSVLHRIDESGAESRVLAGEDGPARVIRVEPGVGFTGWVAQKGRELLLSEPAGDPRFDTSVVRRIGIPLRNLAAVPLPFAEEGPIRGALLIANKGEPAGFGEQDLVLLRLIAAQLAGALEHLAGRSARERERRLATVGRLLAGVLHDLKSPITVVSGYAELLAERAACPEAEEYLEHVRRALGRISAMAEEIIAFSRGERRVLARSTSLPEFMECFARQIRAPLQGRNIELELHLRTAGTARIDEDKMLRVFHNVVNNAVEAMPRGGKLIIEVDNLGRELMFGFTDTGDGIPDEIQGSLFESFVTLGKEHGTGLGLAVSREIVEAHGGHISFTTVRGGGTTFLITIPAA
jgi:signal transduction histidine kinase/putative methionine-R-sulfoxide reductase with GAF domain